MANAVDCTAQQKGQWVPGQYGLNAGVVPEPGFTYLNLAINYSADALNDSNGNRLPAVTGTYEFWVDENIFMFVPKKKILGGYFAPFASVNVANGSLVADIGGAFGTSAGGTGLADTLVAPVNFGCHFGLRSHFGNRRQGRKRFILNVVNAHLDAAATEAEIRRHRDVHRAISAVLVEDKANGPALIQRLKINVSGVIEISPQGGKTARMVAAAPEWQAGDWYVDRNAAWTEPFVEQITTFPNAANDDMADAMSQAASWLLQATMPSVTISNAFSGQILAQY